MSLLEVRGLTFSYGDRDILRGMDFSAEANTVVSVLGPNGVGKTTLLKCICGINTPSSGSILVDGDDILGLPPREFARRVAYVPQNAGTSRTTVFDTVLIGRKPHMQWAMGDSDMDAAWDAITALGLEDIALKNTDEISGGEFQKVHIARALVQDPRLLVLDEPSSSLDIANQHRIMRTVSSLAKERGLCTVMTMHDINLASRYSDVFVFVKDGRIHSCGGQETITPETIREVYGMETEVIEHRGRRVVLPGGDDDL